MNQKPEVYLYGQVLGTHSFLLRDGFLKPDEYSEIRAQYFLPGGETGTAATVLDSLGVPVRVDGTWIGTEVAPMLKAFYADKRVDLTPLRFTKDDPGLMDYVVIAGLARSPMGAFRRCSLRESAGGAFRGKRISSDAGPRPSTPISGRNRCWRRSCA